jgi:Mycothiol maleylpyruvate isomerase N-terminal domain
MTVFDDLSAEQQRLEDILGGLDEAQWLSASGATGWTIADVVLHLAQSEESVVVTASGGELRGGLGQAAGGTVDERVAFLVSAERAAPDVVFARWQRARRAALDARPNRASPGRQVTSAGSPRAGSRRLRRG